MVYLWKIPNDYPEEHIGRYVRGQSPDRFLFLRGTPVSGDMPSPSVVFDASLEKAAKFDVLPNSAMVPLISEKVSTLLLEMCPNDVQFVDTEVIAGGKKLSGYKLLNATHLLACVDHRESEYVFIPNTDAIMKFNRLKLKPTCLGEHDLAREAEYTSYLYVSQRVKDAFDSRRWRGYSFVPPESVHS